MRNMVLKGGRIATLSGAEFGLIENGAIAISGSEIAWVGQADALPLVYQSWHSIDLEGRLVTPALIDCHTHLVYAGSRAREFDMRLNGASYAEIAEAGGGIRSTVAATRQASDEELLKGALARLDNLLAEGVSTVEIKSGYGLDKETELRQLRIARRLETIRPVRICTTFLGAHAVPEDMNADDYIDNVCIPALRDAAAEGLVDAVDGFCETIGFTPAQITRVFDAAKELGLPVKLHAEQLSDQRGAALAAGYNALSAGHLEYLSRSGAEAMAQSGTVAVLLPGAFYFLRETKLPPMNTLRELNIPMALATDSNPGSSPMSSILLAMNMGATLFHMTPLECFKAVTINAAKALGLVDTGLIASGQRADLAIWDVDHPAELTYRIGDAPLHQRVFGGERC